MMNTLFEVFDCPNYKLLNSLLSVEWKVKFGNPESGFQKLLNSDPQEFVYDIVVDIITNDAITIDCQLAKILFRIIIELRNKNETFHDYLEWRDIEYVTYSTHQTFLDTDPNFDYIIESDLPGILLDDIPPLSTNAYLETYWYSPKVTKLLMDNSSEDVQYPGIHCIYYNGLWLYFGEHGLIKTNDVNTIISRIQSICINDLGIDPGIIVMNPEDTRICFND